MTRLPLVFALAVCLVSVGAGPAFSQTRADIRVMPLAELVSKAVLIARVRVDKTDESDFSDFRQVATLDVVDVIDGDYTVKKVRVAADSYIANTDDKYKKKEEWVVFLFRDGGFYRTLNYQHGRFRVEGEVVRNWRDRDGAISDKPFYSVREDIEMLITELHTPVVPAETAPAPVAEPNGGSAKDRPGQPPIKPKSGPPKISRPDRP